MYKQNMTSLSLLAGMTVEKVFLLFFCCFYQRHNTMTTEKNVACCKYCLIILNNLSKGATRLNPDQTTPTGAARSACPHSFS